MKKRLTDLLRRVRVQFSREHFESVWNTLRTNGIKFGHYFTADDNFIVNLSYRDWCLLCRALPQACQSCHIVEAGILPMLHRHRGRIGLLLGGAVALSLFLLLNAFVWDIRISGNQYLSDDHILAELAEAGLSVGKPLRELNTKEIAGDALLASDGLSYISINMRGTVAYVHVMERQKNEDTPSEAGGSNLVAAQDAVIDTLSIAAGAIQVHRGQVVKAGDLLVSGITEGSDGSHVLHARGEVYGVVERRFEVVLPRDHAEKSISQKKTVALAISFLGKSINIYANTGNLPPTYDTIYEKEQLYLGEAISLPFWMQRTVAIVDAQERVPLTEQEVVALAYRRMEAEITQALRNGELLKKHMYGRFTEDAYILVCEATCLENIAKEVAFESR